MTDKEKTLAFIEERIKWNEDMLQRDPKPSDIGRIEEAKCIRRFIESLQEEPVSEDLEKAAFDYAESCKYDGGEKLLCVEHFKAGVKWSKNQAKVEIQAQSMALAHGCPKEELVSEELEEAAKNHAVERYRATRDMVLAEKCKWSFKIGAEWRKEQITKVLLSEVLPYFMRGGEVYEVVDKLDKVLNQKK